jgi:hypothetical protein
MLRRAALTLTLLTLFTSPLLAQGKSLGKGRGAKPSASQQTTVTQQSASIPGTGVRHFGSWLDDASFLEKGKGWTTLGIGYWRSIDGHQWDVPSIDAGMAIHRRVHVGFSTPFSRSSYGDGYTSSGFGDTYLSAKVGIIDPDQEGHHFGFAVVPVLEILSSGSVIEGGDRLHWAIPVTLERRFEDFRVYGSGGYFSRGSVFAAGAVEVPLSDRIVVTGVLSHSRSLKDDPLSDAMQLSTSRFDLNGSFMYVVTPVVTAFGTIGRTISHTDANASTLAVSGGVSFGFNTVQTHQKKKQ